MPRGPITTVRQASPTRLTEVLRAAGALPTGEVARVQTISSRPSPGGRVARLAVEYTGAAPSAACATLFLKMGYGWGEVGFYRAAARHPELPVLTCYDAVFSERSERCRLLLEDARDSHGPASEWPLPPARDRAEAIVDGVGGQGPGAGNGNGLCDRMNRMSRIGTAGARAGQRAAGTPSLPLEHHSNRLPRCAL